MLDLKALKENTEEYKVALQKRNISNSLIDQLLDLDQSKRQTQTEVENLQSELNKLAKEIPHASTEDRSSLVEQSKKLKEDLKNLEPQLENLQNNLNNILFSIPNIPHPSVPEGKDENDNIEIKKWGEIPNIPNPQDHVTLGENLGILDLETASKISSSRFSVLKGLGAKLERALASFMLDKQISAGYLEVIPPYLVNSDSLFATGNLPKFEEDLFKVPFGNSNLYLIPTAEVPITNLHRGEILEGNKLPIKYCSLTPCFRSEAGSYGKDTRGIIRQHQFHKVELVIFSKPKQAEEEHEKLTRNAEMILEELELPYRRILLCSGDMGFSSTKTYDLEVWMPSQNKYREISSCSWFSDFQARRGQIRYKEESANNKNLLVHTLNGSGLAVGRTWVAILENYQQEDGSIKIPKVLQPYFNGLTEIR